MIPRKGIEEEKSTGLLCAGQNLQGIDKFLIIAKQGYISGEK